MVRALAVGFAFHMVASKTPYNHLRLSLLQVLGAFPFCPRTAKPFTDTGASQVLWEGRQCGFI